MSSPETSPSRESAWHHLCEENGWSCKICGAFPAIGTQFEGNMCEDCQLRLHNYDPTAT